LNLRLTPLAEKHLETVRHWRASEEVSRFMFTDPVLTPDGQRAWFRSQVLGNPTALWWILEAEAGPIGLVNVTGIDRLNGRCEWGYYIGDPSLRGKGIGTRIARTLFDYVFDELRLHRVTTEVLSDNDAGLRLPEKMGCLREGTLRGHILKRGLHRDVVVFGLLSEDWRRIRSGISATPIPILESPA